MKCQICGSEIKGEFDYMDHYLLEETYSCENCKMYTHETITGNTAIWLRPFRRPALMWSYNTTPTKFEEMLYAIKWVITWAIYSFTQE